MKIEVEVTTLDIKKGMPQASKDCPLYYAIKRALRANKIWAPYHVKVGVVDVELTDRRGDRSRDVDLPQRAVNFLAKFDQIKRTGQKKDLKSFKFKLNVPTIFLSSSRKKTPKN